MKYSFTMLTISLALILSSCQPPTGTVPGADSGVASPVTLTLSNTSGGFTVATKSYGGSYGPKHVLAVWVEDPQGSFVKTVAVWAAERKSHLTTWAAANAGWENEIDTVSGATIGNHTGTNGTKALSWDLKNKAGAAVSDGSYSLVAEMTEANSGSKVARLTVTVSGGSVAAAP